MTNVDTAQSHQETDATMYDKDEWNGSLVSWMIAGGARLDRPDPRRLGHLVALRDAGLDAARSGSPFTRFSAWLSSRPPLAGAATATVPTATTCCAPA